MNFSVGKQTIVKKGRGLSRPIVKIPSPISSFFDKTATISLASSSSSRSSSGYADIVKKSTAASLVSSVSSSSSSSSLSKNIGATNKSTPAPLASNSSSSSSLSKNNGAANKSTATSPASSNNSSSSSSSSSSSRRRRQRIALRKGIVGRSVAEDCIAFVDSELRRQHPRPTRDHSNEPDFETWVESEDAAIVAKKATRLYAICNNLISHLSVLEKECKRIRDPLYDLEQFMMNSTECEEW